MDTLLTKNPCIDVCAFDDGTCTACGRTKKEKKRWKALPPEERNRIWARIMESHGTGKGKHRKALRARHAKVSRKAAEQARAALADQTGRAGD
jgi:predicted Fe-S protein YdhL (DUF1289 family)